MLDAQLHSLKLAGLGHVDIQAGLEGLQKRVCDGAVFVRSQGTIPGRHSDRRGGNIHMAVADAHLFVQIMQPLHQRLTILLEEFSALQCASVMRDGDVK